MKSTVLIFLRGHQPGFGKMKEMQGQKPQPYPSHHVQTFLFSSAPKQCCTSTSCPWDYALILMVTMKLAHSAGHSCTSLLWMNIFVQIFFVCGAQYTSPLLFPLLITYSDLILCKNPPLWNCFNQFSDLLANQEYSPLFFLQRCHFIHCYKQHAGTARTQKNLFGTTGTGRLIKRTVIKFSATVLRSGPAVNVESKEKRYIKNVTSEKNNLQNIIVIVNMSPNSINFEENLCSRLKLMTLYESPSHPKSYYLFLCSTIFATE